MLDYFLKVDWLWERTQGRYHGFELENWKNGVVINRDGQDDRKKQEWGGISGVCLLNILNLRCLLEI